MSKTGDRSALLTRRQAITADAPPCPVCGRPVVTRTTAVHRDRCRWIRTPACSTSCLEAMRQRKAANP